MSSTHVAEVREQVADPLAALAVLLELPLRPDDAALVLLAAAAERLDRDRLAVEAVELRLVVEGIDVARPAVHEQEDDALRLGRRSAAASGASGLANLRPPSAARAPGEEAVAPTAGPSAPAPAKPPPASQRNSRRVRPQKLPAGRRRVMESS